jgi:hypothetical protein
MLPPLRSARPQSQAGPPMTLVASRTCRATGDRRLKAAPDGSTKPPGRSSPTTAADLPVRSSAATGSFTTCRYNKTRCTCAEPDHLSGCPLPNNWLRNGGLNQTAYALHLFIRDVAGGDLVGWIDRRLNDVRKSTAPMIARDDRIAAQAPCGDLGRALRLPRRRLTAEQPNATAATWPRRAANHPHRMCVNAPTGRSD